MNINRTNYEEYFLDFLEGRLPAEEIAELLAFAHANPDLKALIDDEEWLSLEPDASISFVPKSALKKADIADTSNGPISKKSPTGATRDINRLVTTDNYEEAMIGYYDQSLTDEEKAALAHFLNDHPTYIREFEIFGNTYLTAEQNVVYPRKSALKRHMIGAPGLRKTIAVVSVAASLLLFSTLFLKYQHQPPLKDIRNARVLTASGTASHKGASLAVSDAQKNQAATSYPIIKPSRYPALEETKVPVKERIPLAALASMNPRPAKEIAASAKALPATISTNNDFEGVTYLSYLDREGPANPMTTGTGAGGSRLASTLAKGISQTAGSLARGSEIGRLLRGNVSLADIASLGLAGYNLISARDLSLQRDYDENGQPKGYSLVDGNRRVTRLP